MTKLPTWKDLGINIKEILWKNDFNTFEEFKNAYSNAFCAKLGHYLSKNNKHTKYNFSLAYNVIFYYGYINQRREQELLTLLTKNEYKVNSTFMIIDAVIGVDLIATKFNKTYVIQVKSNNNFSNLKHIKAFANSRNYEIILAYKKQNQWIFMNENLENVYLF